MWCQLLLYDLVVREIEVQERDMILWCFPEDVRILKKGCIHVFIFIPELLELVEGFVKDAKHL